MDLYTRIIFVLASVALAAADSCLNPAGKDCSWYANCLEKQIPCGADGYALKYATHYCTRYEQNAKDFSDYGQRWIVAAKRCLQRKLVPLLSMKPKPNCDYIKKFAFETHVACYVQPDLGAPSFCKLSTLDYYRVFKTIRGAFLNELKATVSGGFSTLVSCWRKQGRRRRSTV